MNNTRSETDDETSGEVEETWTDDQIGVEVRRVRTEQVGAHDRVRLNLYEKRRDCHQSLEGDGCNEVERLVKIATLPPQTATKVLFGLAEAHGYELVEK